METIAHFVVAEPTYEENQAADLDCCDVDGCDTGGAT